MTYDPNMTCFEANQLWEAEETRKRRNQRARERRLQAKREALIDLHPQTQHAARRMLRVWADD